MKKINNYVLSRLITGIVVIIPVYLSLLLVAKAIRSVGGLVHPIGALLPEWLPGEDLAALVLVLILCLVVGTIARTTVGQTIRERVERSLFMRIPGYALLRSLTQRLVGDNRENAWKPAFAEIEEALVPAFIIEEFDDGRYTVFVPSVPTPLAGAVYILDRARVHPVDVPFTRAISVISRWGQGSRDMVAVMESKKGNELSQVTEKTCETPSQTQG